MQDIPFIETTVARRIFSIIDLARSSGECAAIIGEPGVGKTRSINEYKASRPGTALITVNPITGNAFRDLLRELADVLGIYVSGSIAQIQQQMFRYDLSGHVLIIDEAQNLKLQAMRGLQEMHDHAGLSVIFCGNRDVLRRVNVENGPLAQISDRIGFREQIDCIPGEDADAITNGFGVEGMDAYKLARAIGMRFRARALVRVLTAARMQAGDKKTIKAEHIRNAIELFPQYRAAITAKAARSAVA